MEVTPNFYIAVVHDASYDETIISNTTKFFDNFTEARLWLSETCKERARELYELNKIYKSESLYGELAHYYAGRTISYYTLNGHLDCESLDRLGYPRSNGRNWGNLIPLLSKDEKEWLMNYLNPNNSHNVYNYNHTHEKVWNILNGKCKWNESERDWEDFE